MAGVPAVGGRRRPDVRRLRLERREQWQDAFDPSVYGTLDAGVASYTSPEHLALLGSDVALTPIEGGNHEQMGWYTGQPNDPPATISRDEQQRQVVDATLDLLTRLAGS